MRIIFFIFFTTFLILNKSLFSQKNKYDTILTAAIIIGNDTLPHKDLPEIIIREMAPNWLAKQRRQRANADAALIRLRRNVYIAYPYALAAAYILKDVDSVLNGMHSKEAKKQFKRRKELELSKRFKNELENLTIEQGQVLVKLIARETGKPCYEIIKEMKGGFNATIWQTVAILFSNNLRNHYDATGEDANIETILNEIMSRGHFERKK